MKKTFLLKTMLLLCALVVGSANSVWAEDADVTYDFTSGWSVNNGTLTNGSVSFTGEGGANFKMNSGYFMMGKKDAYITFPTYSSAVSKIVVTGRSGASASTGMNVYVGTTAVSTETEGCTGTNTYEIASGYQAAGTTYTLKVTSSHNAQITKIEVFYASGSTVATPTFSPAEGTFTSAQNVEISTTTEDATIYYTTDGSTPTTSSNVYSSAIAISTTTTIKAIAVKDGYDNSSIATATYTIVSIEHAGTQADPYTVADARTAIDAGIGMTNVYVTGIVSEIVTAYNATYGNISYNISADGETTSDQLQAFRGKSYNGEDFTSEDDIQVGDVVVVLGTLTKYNEIYEFEKDNQLVSLNRPAETRVDAELSWSESEVNIALGASDSEYTLPTLQNPNNAAPVTYEITGTDNLAIEVNGEIIVDTDVEGTVTVTASFAGDETYNPAQVSYTITVADPNAKGTINNPYTVAEVIDGTATGSDIYVRGFIVGEYVGKTTNPRTSGFTTDANIAIADEFTASPTAGTSIPVALPTSALKNAWGCQTSNGARLGYEVLIKGNKDTYFSVNGIKGTSEVAAISIPATVTAAGYATFSAPYAVDFSATDVEVYTAAVNGDKVMLTAVDSKKVPANTAVILKGETVTGTVIASADALEDNELLVSDGTVVGNGSIYVLAKKDAVGFYKLANDVTIPAGKCYLDTAASAPEFLGFSFGGETTGISQIENGKLRIENVYNLNGQRVAQPSKGLYIMNGRKVVIK